MMYLEEWDQTNSCNSSTHVMSSNIKKDVLSFAKCPIVDFKKYIKDIAQTLSNPSFRKAVRILNILLLTFINWCPLFCTCNSLNNFKNLTSVKTHFHPIWPREKLHKNMTWIVWKLCCLSPSLRACAQF
jgi:hypothetical protein